MVQFAAVEACERLDSKCLAHLVQRVLILVTLTGEAICLAKSVQIKGLL